MLAASTKSCVQKQLAGITAVELSEYCLEEEEEEDGPSVLLLLRLLLLLLLPLGRDGKVAGMGLLGLGRLRLRLEEGEEGGKGERGDRKRWGEKGLLELG